MEVQLYVISTVVEVAMRSNDVAHRLYMQQEEQGLKTESCMRNDVKVVVLDDAPPIITRCVHPWRYDIA